MPGADVCMANMPGTAQSCRIREAFLHLDLPYDRFLQRLPVAAVAIGGKWKHPVSIQSHPVVSWTERETADG